jgi:Protein of unknown function (DUF1091)
MSHTDAVTNPDYAHLDINVKNQTAVLFDVSADTHRIIDGKIKMEIELLKKSTDAYRSLLVLTVRNVCEILNHRSETPLIDLIIQIVSQYGIIPQSCPMEKGHYYLKDFLLPDFVFDMLLSSGHYQIKVEFFDENDAMPVSIHKSTYSAIMTQEPST